MPAFGSSGRALCGTLLGGVEQRVCEGFGFDFALNQVLAGAFVPRPLAHGCIVESRQDNHRHLQGLFVDIEDGAQARSIIEKQVEKNDVELMPGQASEAFLETPDMRELEIGCSHVSQGFLNKAGVTGIVFDE